MKLAYRFITRILSTVAVANVKFCPIDVSSVQPRCLDCLDLPSLQVALELLALASYQGLGSWTSVTLDGKAFKLRGTAKNLV